jgi:hypothetical protein
VSTSVHQTTSPTPTIALEGKDRLDAGQRLPREAPRPWYCRSCGQERAPSRNVPSGWYTLARHTGSAEKPMLRLGVYCSIDCLEDQLPRLGGIAAAARLPTLMASPYIQVRDERRLCSRCGRSYTPDPDELAGDARCHGCRPRVIAS